MPRYASLIDRRSRLQTQELLFMNTETSPLAHPELADLHDEQRMLALLTVDLDCSQQKFFQGEYGRHRRSPIVALLLCLLLGNFGAHEFYFGRVLSGLVRLLFSWTFVPWLLALVEAPRVPAYAKRYNIELAQSIVDMLHEIREHVRRLDGGEALRPAAAPSSRLVGTPTMSAQPANPLGRAATNSAPFVPLVTLSGGAALASAQAKDGEVSAQGDAPHAAPHAAQFDPEDDEAPSAPAPSREPVFAYSLGARPHPPVRYGPPLVEYAPTPPQSQRVRRIVVRKVALVDGQVVGEAVATREVALDDKTDPRPLAQRIELATKEARR